MLGSILLVDDDIDILVSIRAILETEDYEAYTACNADQAKAIITEKDVHIVIMDYVLPDFTGDQIVKDLKQIDGKLNIIFLSGPSRVFKAVEALKFDVQRIFLKPINPESLLSAIRNIHAEQIDPHQFVDTHQIVYEQS